MTEITISVQGSDDQEEAADQATEICDLIRERFKLECLAEIDGNLFGYPVKADD